MSTRKRRGSAIANTKQAYPIPVGKLNTCSTPDFDIRKHRQLSQRDFNDPLDYIRWKIWFTDEKYKHDMNTLEKERVKLINLGNPSSPPSQ